jgi:hypothetical protein
MIGIHVVLRQSDLGRDGGGDMLGHPLGVGLCAVAGERSQ